MKKNFCYKMLFGCLMICICISSAMAKEKKLTDKNESAPIIIIAVDQVSSYQIYSKELPGLQRFLAESACGLMNIRSLAGYTGTSGYLTLSGGKRAYNNINSGITFYPEEELKQGTARNYYEWLNGREIKKNSEKVIIPEISFLTKSKSTQANPDTYGLLGSRMRNKGWKTIVIGDLDTNNKKKRPGGLILTDQDGVLDQGYFGGLVNEKARDFPYEYRLNIPQVIKIMKKHTLPKQLILVDFTDFARLQTSYKDILPKQYEKLLTTTWLRFDFFLQKVLESWSPKEATIILITPSIARYTQLKNDSLGLMAIRSQGMPPGLIKSGTTNWEGLVANVDFLPTILQMAQLELSTSIAGRRIEALEKTNHLAYLRKLNQKIITVFGSYRNLLNLYITIVNIVWLAFLAALFWRRGWWAKGLLLLTYSIPLALLIMPLLPKSCWNEWGLVGLFLSLLIISIRFKNFYHQYLGLTLLFWLVIVIDQLTGWQLIRFSPLGYSPIYGSRYYGIGNEYMGIFLANSLILSHLLYNYFWPKKEVVVAVLGISVCILGWPGLGVNFGGTLAALIGFSFYIFRLYNFKWFTSQKAGLVFLVFFGLIMLVGLFDSLRPTESQTHFGKFFQMILLNNQGEIWQIIFRKLQMNFKLLLFSAWTRVILLAGLVSLVVKYYFKKNFGEEGERLLPAAILVSGGAAFFLNDSGVVAFGTCLSYGFSFLLAFLLEKNQIKKES